MDEFSENTSSEEPSDLIELLYQGSFKTLKKLASIYERRGLSDKAAEISDVLQQHEYLPDDQTRGAA
jgi:hypothetical protein